MRKQRIRFGHLNGSIVALGMKQFERLTIRWLFGGRKRGEASFLSFALQCCSEHIVSLGCFAGSSWNGYGFRLGLIVRVDSIAVKTAQRYIGIGPNLGFSI